MKIDSSIHLAYSDICKQNIGNHELDDFCFNKKKSYKKLKKCRKLKKWQF